MNKLPPAQLLNEVEDVLRTMPSLESFGNDTPEHISWLGRASAVIHAWDPIKAIALFDRHVAKMNSRSARDVEAGARPMLTMLHQARHDLRMRTQGPLSVNVEAGGVFDYFDEIRKVIEAAKLDLLFVDPYLDAEFVSRYLPHVSRGVKIRLLARERLATLLPSVTLLRQQSGQTIDVRSTPGFHDRYVIVDGISCYQSGASFKDGAKKAPTTLTQITDAFPAVHSTYEDLWNKGTPQV
jgi:hypothetical protein